MKNFNYCVYTYLHRKAFEFSVHKVISDEKIKEEMLKRAKVHDMDKMLMYLFMDKKEASKVHRKISNHHMENDLEKNYFDYLEAIIDYECAGYTKEDKPRNAYDAVLFVKESEHPWQKEKLDMLMNIINELGINSSYLNGEDMDAKKYFSQFLPVTEKDILKEIHEYISFLSNNN